MFWYDYYYEIWMLDPSLPISVIAVSFSLCKYARWKLIITKNQTQRVTHFFPLNIQKHPPLPSPPLPLSLRYARPLRRVGFAYLWRKPAWQARWISETNKEKCFPDWSEICQNCNWLIRSRQSQQRVSVFHPLTADRWQWRFKMTLK